MITKKMVEKEFKKVGFKIKKNTNVISNLPFFEKKIASPPYLFYKHNLIFPFYLEGHEKIIIKNMKTIIK